MLFFYLPHWIWPPVKKWRILLIFLPILVILCKEIKKHFGCDIFGWHLHSKDILLCYGIPQMSINTTIFLYKLAFLYHMKRYTTETYLSPHINNSNHFQHHWLSDFTIITVTLSLLSLLSYCAINRIIFAIAHSAETLALLGGIICLV